ncbi:hypothetical protein [Taibaiella soli]|uniref:Uncharacterized protein n=1 Tax=Taibaiella soli TaxID=1649169 RepID=A0A2W2ABP8_9BACT|nr:hypothetical protein [Taibaiella soli]PZF72845.1 hypothetical protein DN068_10550 [Taibaiella soli]
MYRNNSTLDDLVQEAILRNICCVANFFEERNRLDEAERAAALQKLTPKHSVQQHKPVKKTHALPSYLSGPLQLYAMDQSRRMIPHMQLGFGMDKSFGGNIGGKVKNDSLNWYGPLGKANAVFGTVASIGEATKASFRLFKGAFYGGRTFTNFSPKWYSSAWRGGSTARIKTFNVSNIGKLAGWTGIGIGVIADIRGVIIWRHHPNDPNAVTPIKASINTGVSLYALAICSPVGLVYFGVDAFYPGGLFGDAEHPGFFMDETTFQHEIDQISNAGPNMIRLIPFGAK